MFKNYYINNRWVESKGYYFGALHDALIDIGQRWYNTVNAYNIMRELYEISVTALERWDYELDYGGYRNVFSSESSEVRETFLKIISLCEKCRSNEIKRGYAYMATIPNLIETAVNCINYICTRG